MSYPEHQRQKVSASDRVTFFSHPVTITGGSVFRNAEREFPVETRHCLVSVTHKTQTRHCLVSTPSTEPYYQLMRQTLLAYEMTKAKEYGATEYQHLHIIPKENKELKEVNTAEGKLDGTNLQETWTRLLKSPGKYKVMYPKDFISPAKKCRDTLTAITYMEKRYWN